MIYLTFLLPVIYQPFRLYAYIYYRYIYISIVETFKTLVRDRGTFVFPSLRGALLLEFCCGDCFERFLSRVNYEITIGRETSPYEEFRGEKKVVK